jgi:argininosuccinate lyase
MLVMLEKADWKTAKMSQALRGDFSNATDLADFLVTKKLAFRQAHEVIGKIVNFCLKSNLALEDISLAQLKEFSPLFDQSALALLPHLAVMRARGSEGGTAPSAVLQQIQKAELVLN